MSDKINSSGGSAFFSLLTILFIGLKLTNHIDWSWFWVLSPIILPILLICIILFGYLVWLFFEK